VSDGVVVHTVASRGVGRVGDGALPHELDRVNWGAALLGILWALAHGTWPWFWGLVGVRVVWYAAVYAFRMTPWGQAPGLGFAVMGLGPLLLLGADAVYAARANRLYWTRERDRVIRQSDHSVPRLADPIDEYLKGQRSWATVGIVLFVLSSLLGLSELVSRPTVGLQSALAVAVQLGVLGALYAYDQSHRFRGLSQS
jgi:hypothetical protein